MRISLLPTSIDSLDIHSGCNVQGDEIVARAWHKWLKRHPKVTDVTFNHISNGSTVIHFSPFNEPVSNSINVLYFQNAFPPEYWEGGTIGQFHKHKHKFQHFVFTSAALKQACGVDGAVIPFAADHEVYYPDNSSQLLAHQLVFVGNNIRGPEVNTRYLAPCLDLGLTIYGANNWLEPWCGRYMDRSLAVKFDGACKGKITIDQERLAYSTSSICVNAHLDEHIKHDTVNFRIFTILACGGCVLTDSVPSLNKWFADVVTQTTGDDDLIVKANDLLGDSLRRKQIGMIGRELVLEKHTFVHRMIDLVDFLSGL